MRTRRRSRGRIDATEDRPPRGGQQGFRSPLADEASDAGELADDVI